MRLLVATLAVVTASSTAGHYGSSAMAIVPAIEACRAIVADGADEELVAKKLHFYISPVRPVAEFKFDEITSSFFQNISQIRFMTPEPRPSGRPVYVTLSSARNKCLVQSAAGSARMFGEIIAKEIRSAQDVVELDPVELPQITARRFTEKRGGVRLGYRAAWIPGEGRIAVGTERLSQ